MTGISSSSRPQRSPAAEGLQKRGTLSMRGHAAEDRQAPRKLLLSGKGPVQGTAFEGTGGWRGGGLVAKLCPTLATPWTVACHAPLSMAFSRREYWSGLPFPSPGDLPDPGIEPTTPALAGGFFSFFYH